MGQGEFLRFVSHRPTTQDHVSHHGCKGRQPTRNDAARLRLALILVLDRGLFFHRIRQQAPVVPSTGRLPWLVSRFEPQRIRACYTRTRNITSSG